MGVEVKLLANGSALATFDILGGCAAVFPASVTIANVAYTL
jgi:hypothetical protein